MDKILAYARLLGLERSSLDYYVRQHAITIGRKTGTADCKLKSESPHISRLHAKLEYNHDLKQWEIRCFSKNGLMVNGMPCFPEHPALPLVSQDVIEIVDELFCFLGPKPPILYLDDVSRMNPSKKRENKKVAIKTPGKKFPVIKLEAVHGSRDVIEIELIKLKAAGMNMGKKRKRSSIGKWSKRDQQDFLRALSTIGSPLVIDGGGDVKYDWKNIRKYINSNFSTNDCKEFYEKLISDVNGILEDAKGIKAEYGALRRTKHRQDCDCPVCERAKRTNIKKPASKVPQVSTKNRLVTLIVAQKLRNRMALLDAARHASDPNMQVVMERFENEASLKYTADYLPTWWQNGRHDRALMLGVARIGYGKWDLIWKDPDNTEFRTLRKQKGIAFPNRSVFEKRTKELAFAIQAQLRRNEKRYLRLLQESGKTATLEEYHLNPRQIEGQNEEENGDDLTNNNNENVSSNVSSEESDSSEDDDENQEDSEGERESNIDDHDETDESTEADDEESSDDSSL